MPPEDQNGATAGSPPANTEGTPSPGSKQGATPPLENLQAENKRLSDKLTKLQEQLEEGELTRDEMREEMEKIKSQFSNGNGDKAKTPKQRLQEYKNNPAYKDQLDVLNELAQEIADQKIRQFQHEDQVAEMEDMLVEKAEELGMDTKEFRSKILPYAGKHSDKAPILRFKTALREYLKDQAKLKSLDEREKALREKEESDKLYAETGGRTPQQETVLNKIRDHNGDMQKLGDALTEAIG